LLDLSTLLQEICGSNNLVLAESIQRMDWNGTLCRQDHRSEEVPYQNAAHPGRHDSGRHDSSGKDGLHGVYSLEDGNNAAQYIATDRQMAMFPRNIPHVSLRGFEFRFVVVLFGSPKSPAAERSLCALLRQLSESFPH